MWKKGKTFRHRGQLKRYIYKNGSKRNRRLVNVRRRRNRFNRRW